MEDRQWEAVLRREPDASFVYAVTTTGIFCRANCPSRRPNRAHVQFFPDGAVARAAGFRPCLRCRPGGPSAHAELAERVASLLRANMDRQVSLGELARSLGVSAGTVQRVFTAVVGMSPRAFTNALRAERFRSEVQAPNTRITDAVYAAGFSAPSRAEQAAPLGMAAKRYRIGGAGERIGYTVTPAPLGLGFALLAATERGLCAVLLGSDAAELTAELKGRFPAAVLAENPSLAERFPAVFSSETGAAAELPLDLRATAFQARVWAALQAIPHGETRTYAQVATSLGNSKAVRAVARACAQNPVALVVPCHRVVGSNGSLTGYRWGLERKQALLDRERRRDPRP